MPVNAQQPFHVSEFSLLDHPNCKEVSLLTITFICTYCTIYTHCVPCFCKCVIWQNVQYMRLYTCICMIVALKIKGAANGVYVCVFCNTLVCVYGNVCRLCVLVVGISFPHILTVCVCVMGVMSDWGWCVHV